MPSRRGSCPKRHGKFQRCQMMARQMIAKVADRRIFAELAFIWLRSPLHFLGEAMGSRLLCSGPKRHQSPHHIVAVNSTVKLGHAGFHRLGGIVPLLVGSNGGSA